MNPDFSSGQTSGSSAQFSQPLSTNNLWSSVVDPALHSLTNTTGQDFSKGQFVAGASAAGTNQNYSPAASYGPTAPTSSPSNNGGYSGGGAPTSPGQNVNQVQNGYRWDGSAWQPPANASGPSQDDINKAIDDTYNASNQYLDQAQSQLQSDYPTTQQNINDQFNNDQSTLQTGYNQNLTAFGQQADQAAYNNENALAQARRLYSEVNQGYQQRFGGSTSAGQAAGEIANVAQQQQEGQDQRAYQQASTAINTQRTNTEQNFANSQQGLLVAKNQALQQAQQDFQAKLLQITQNRAANEQAKGQAKLQALQDLRNQVFAINQQNTQFQQTLAAQQNQGAIQLRNYQALAGTGVNTGAMALGVYQNGGYANPTTNLGAGAPAANYTNAQTGQPAYVGAISSNGLKYDQYGNVIQ